MSDLGVELVRLVEEAADAQKRKAAAETASEAARQTALRLASEWNEALRRLDDRIRETTKTRMRS